mgnify:CR=1 FL=1
MHILYNAWYFTQYYVAIQSAKVEARCNYPNGIGIIQLMGRSSGLIAVHATLSSGDVDLCLVPEVYTPLNGENCAFAFLKKRVEEQGHAVIVVAEGFGEQLFKDESHVIEYDAGGNKKLPIIGPTLKHMVEDYFKSNNSVASVKFIDPSYMIRSVPANSSDSVYCMQLAQNVSIVCCCIYVFILYSIYTLYYYIGCPWGYGWIYEL